MQKLGVIFGGMSTENKVSVISASSVLKNLDREKYEIYPIYIDENGEWYNYTEKIETIENVEKQENTEQIVKIEDIQIDGNIQKIENVVEFLKELDVVFPVLHGLYGEDGTIQGLMELLKIPYVGCKVLASSISMDKVYTKIILKKAGLKQAKYEYIRKYGEKYIYVDGNFNEEILELKEVVKIIAQNLGFPVFIKPSNSGSSVGINKAKNMEELENAIEYASKYDKKILIEQGIVGKEVECAVLGNEDVIASVVGEIKSAEEFYSYDAKYKSAESKTYIPANISEEISNEIRKSAIKAFKAVDGKGLSRVDFFVEENTNEIYINEINTMPGFTSISMYPKLFETSGISYKKLLNRIIALAVND